MHWWVEIHQKWNSSTSDEQRTNTKMPEREKKNFRFECYSTHQSLKQLEWVLLPCRLHVSCDVTWCCGRRRCFHRSHRWHVLAYEWMIRHFQRNGLHKIGDGANNAEFGAELLDAGLLDDVQQSHVVEDAWWQRLKCLFLVLLSQNVSLHPEQLMRTFWWILKTWRLKLLESLKTRPQCSQQYIFKKKNLNNKKGSVTLLSDTQTKNIIQYSVALQFIF